MSIPTGQEHQFQIGALQEERISSLRRTWLVYAVICTALLAAGAWWLGQVWQADYAWRWLMISSLAVIYLLIGLWRGLQLNHPPGSQEV